jgi:lysophospholipase L1-like esterase
VYYALNHKNFKIDDFTYSNDTGIQRRIMARLPQPGGDSGDWGNILNDYLAQAHNPDGTLKDGVVDEAVLSQSVRDSIDAAANVSVGATRPLASSYRPLQGTTTAITSSFSSGEQASATFYRWDTSPRKYRYVGSEPKPFSDPTLGVNFNVGLDGDIVANALEVEFWSNATTIRVYFYNSVRHDVWALVDDQRITDSTYLHADVGDGMCTWTLTQSTGIWRKWRLGLPATTLRGIGIDDGAMTPTAKGFQLGIIGDSYVAGGQQIANAVSPGVSGTISAGTVFGEFAQSTGIDVWRFAVSGSGYVNDAGYSGRGNYGSATRMAALAQAPALDALVVWGTANDKPYGASAVVSAAQQTWNTLHSARPNTPIIVVGPQCTGWPDGPLDVINDALRGAASSNDNVTAYVDLRNNNFMSGTGYDGNLQGDGNADFFISADGGHPTHHGNRYWGENIAKLLGNVVLPGNQTRGTF